MYDSMSSRQAQDAQKNPLLNVYSGGKSQEYQLRGGLTVAQALFAAGVWRGLALCSGAGRCGRCRVRYLENAPAPGAAEQKLLSPQELETGLRLACRQALRHGDKVEPLATAKRKRAKLRQPLPEGRTARLAVDLGTTSLEWSLTSQEPELAHGKELNPQMGAGSEIMSRLAFAQSGGGDELRRVVADRLLELVADLGVQGRLETMCLSANPAMTALAAGRNVSGLATAPYRLDHPGGEWVELDPKLPRCYLPSALGPFVGADVLAGLAALKSRDDWNPPFVLADLGTNGEFVLVLPSGSLLVASVPMGPALEGVGLSCGMVAGPGVITGFGLGVRGHLQAAFYQDKTPDAVLGLSGTGAISLVARLVGAGVLTPQGTFSSMAEPLSRRMAGLLDQSPDGERGFRVFGAGGPRLAASDVEELLKVKAAVNAALSALLAHAGLALDDLSALVLAGALGQHANTADLEFLGFLPQGGAAKTVRAGNTSLAGARALLDNEGLRAWSETLPGRTTVLELTADPDFQHAYLERMVFRYVE